MHALNDRNVVKTKQTTTLPASSLTTDPALLYYSRQQQRESNCELRHSHTTSSVMVDWEKKETTLHLSNPPLSDDCRLHHSDNDLKFGTVL